MLSFAFPRLLRDLASSVPFVAQVRTRLQSLAHALDLKLTASPLLLRPTYRLNLCPITAPCKMSNVGKKHTTVANPSYEPQAYSKSGYSTFKAF